MVSVPLSSEQPSTSVKCIAKRVDALVLAYQIALQEALWTTLEGYRVQAERERHEIECDLGRLVCPHGSACERCRSFVLAVLPVGGPSKVVLRNADVMVTLCKDASHEWTVEVRVFAPFLAQNDVVRAVGVARWVASFFGPFDAERGERVRRVDLATDWMGWVLDDSEDARLVTRPRARKTKFRPTYEELLEVPESRVYKVAQTDENNETYQRVTGVAVAYGSPIMCRIYDKTAELKHTGAEGKRRLEEVAWKHGGWDGRSNVVRVEYQLRGEVLEEMGLRANADKLVQRLDGVWHYLTRDWLTLRVLGTSTRLCRAALDPRWEAVQRVDWGSRSSPVERVRRRGGASMRQTFGCMLSTLGASGALEPAVKSLSAPSVTESRQLKPGAAAAGVRAYVTAICCAFAMFLEAGLLTEADTPQEALGELVLRVRGSVARFSVVEDSEAFRRAEEVYANARREKG